MRIIFAALPLILIAACSRDAGGNNAASSDAAANTANAAQSAPAAANEAKPVGAPVDPAANPRRAGEIQECIQDVRTEVPEGTDLNGFCGCAVDRMQAGGSERQSMEQCAAEMGIEPR